MSQLNPILTAGRDSSSIQVLYRASSIVCLRKILRGQNIAHHKWWKIVPDYLLMNILVSTMLTIDIGDFISTVLFTFSLLHGLFFSIVRPLKKVLLHGTWQHLHETVRASVAVDGTVLLLPPTNHNQVVLPIALVHQVPGIAVNTSRV